MWCDWMCWVRLLCVFCDNCVVVQVVCQHLVMFCGGVQSLTTTIKGAQTLAIKCVLTGIVSAYMYIQYLCRCM